ncbi:S-adenosyl-L-methionine-dependent methyltransferase [Thozetella sp. PMI_491]|nr:S-adenosyl-L-methionine-dependent methyltransferase [Thozetella sp. PMI_491]
MATETPHEVVKDATFRTYTDKQAETYARDRPGYPPALANFIVDHHRNTGGETGMLLDVGCGPGPATRVVAPLFDVAYGADPGEAMIKTATELGGTTKTGVPIEFFVCSAEQIDSLPVVKPGSVDMITVATAAHWFEMPKFWAAAAKVLRPGGTVAIWTTYSDFNVEAQNEAQAKMLEIFGDFQATLEPHKAGGNKNGDSGYRNLELPWDNTATAPLFVKESFVRRDLAADHKTSFNVGAADQEVPETAFKRMQAAMATLSPVTRWREAHPDLAGTDQDCVNVLFARLRQAMIDSNDPSSLRVLLGLFKTAVLLVKRAS